MQVLAQQGSHFALSNGVTAIVMPDRERVGGHLFDQVFARNSVAPLLDEDEPKLLRQALEPAWFDDAFFGQSLSGIACELSPFGSRIIADSPKQDPIVSWAIDEGFRHCWLGGFHCGSVIIG